MSDVAEETVGTFQELAKTQNKVLESNITPMIAMKGDEKAIRRLITILLDNAVKYAKENGRICVTLEKQKKRIRLSVFNTTEQISKEHMEHLFDRSIEQTGQEIPRQEDMDWDFPLQPLQWST